MALQTVVARNIDPQQMAAVTVGDDAGGYRVQHHSAKRQTELSVRALLDQQCA